MANPSLRDEVIRKVIGGVRYRCHLQVYPYTQQVWLCPLGRALVRGVPVEGMSQALVEAGNQTFKLGSQRAEAWPLG